MQEEHKKVFYTEYKMLPVVLEARHWRKLTKSRLSQVFFLGKHKSSGTLSKKSFSIASLFSIFLYNWKSFSINYNLIGSSGCSFLLIGFLQYCPFFCYLLKGNFIWNFSTLLQVWCHRLQKWCSWYYHFTSLWEVFKWRKRILSFEKFRDETDDIAQ